VKRFIVRGVHNQDLVRLLVTLIKSV